ncbi:terminase [Micromonospora sp. CPCC 206060]|uniref:terminase n=1 Tax=Micromonospora sp. CPCC 206060 TaxID=3122406 RepID=UPI002FF16868
MTEPLRPLTRRTSRGYEVIDFAREVLGEPLLPWQEEAVIRGLELNPDGTYRFRVVLILVARQNGKTHLSRVISLWKLYVDGVRLILGVGQDVSLAREVWTACQETIGEVPELAAELDKVSARNGDEWFRLISGARYKISAANRSAGRGMSVDHLNFDEIRQQRAWDAWSALSKTTNARPSAQIWCISNAGDSESVVLNHLREAALAGADPSIGLLEWSGPDGCDLDDPQAWAQANPGLGHTVSEQAIRSALGTDPPAVFRTEVLCQRVDALDSAIDLTAWKDCRDPVGNLESVRERIVAVVDVAPDGRHVALTAAAVLADGRVRVEVVAAWPSTDAARFELGPMLERVKAAAVGWFPSGPAAALGPILRGLGAVEIKGGAVGEACQSFAELVASRRIVHPGDPLLDAHVTGAQKLHQGDGWRFGRRGAGHCNAVYAAAGSVYLALTLPVEKPKPRSAVF